MLAVDNLSARRSTDRTPLICGPTSTRSDHGLAPSSPKLSCTPPLLGRRKLRLIFSNVHLLPRRLAAADEFAFLKADLVEILSVEAGQAQAVEPVEAGQQSVRGGF